MFSLITIFKKIRHWNILKNMKKRNGTKHETMMRYIFKKSKLKQKDTVLKLLH